MHYGAFLKCTFNRGRTRSAAFVKHLEYTFSDHVRVGTFYNEQIVACFYVELFMRKFHVIKPFNIGIS